METNFDFSGWATRSDVLCSDGVMIAHDAFVDDDGKKVPLVWMHQHNSPDNVLGHAILENKGDGVYAYCKFNDSESAQNAKTLVKHGDVKALSIFANSLKKKNNNIVTHGCIREVSLVLAGANPKAYIDDVVMHSDDAGEEYGAYVYGDDPIVIEHACGNGNEDEKKKKLVVEHADEEKNPETKTPEEVNDMTIKEVLDTFTEQQKSVLYALVGAALEDGKEEAMKEMQKDTTEKNTDKEEGEETMKHNLFDTNETVNKDYIAHADDIKTIVKNAKANEARSLKGEFIAHAAEYGIENIDYLFPDYKALNKNPDIVDRDQNWVKVVMGGVHHTPFARIKTLFADITADEARAKGYTKGDLKIEEVFVLLKRTTDPQTIYKKQKLDRDDIVDIVDMDVVAFVKSEMRGKLDEEIARAILVGDGRSAADDYKIKEDHVRPIWTDDEFYCVHKNFTVAGGATEEVIAKAFIKEVRKSRKDYKGSGNPILFTTEDLLTDMLMIEDSTGRVIYETVDKLKNALRVRDIVTVPVMENLTRSVTIGDVSKTHTLKGIYLNLDDYNVGADKGGAVNMFEDFDIDFNQEKYLIETRISGALVKYHGAVAIELRAN